MRRFFLMPPGRVAPGLLAAALVLLHLIASRPAAAQAHAAPPHAAQTHAAQTHFEDCPSRTGQSAAVIVLPASVRVGGAALALGDEIALFTEAGRCAGRTVWQGGGALALTAWGDNAMTDVVDGFEPGHRMQVRLWDASRQVEHHEGNSEIQVRLRTRSPYAQPRLHYVPNGLYVIEQLRVKAPDGL